MTRVIAQGWRNELTGLVKAAKHSLMITTPYIKRAEAVWLRDLLRGTVDVDTLSNLDASAISNGALDLTALLELSNATPKSRLFAIASLHAKVFLADESMAIITSGNLTRSGLDSNLEYGVFLDEPPIVKQVRQDMMRYAAFGSPVATGVLEELLPVEQELRDERANVANSVDPEIAARFNDLAQNAQNTLIGLQLGDRPANTVFRQAILFVLARGGSLTTPQIHEEIRVLLPELCDDSVDRVINGRRFGKRWKHSVRNAQQSLKASREITLDPESGLWSLTGA